MDPEDLEYPSGGPVKMVLLGIAAPLMILKYSLGVWVSKVAIIPQRNGSDALIEGPGAQALAVTYGFFALFCHFRWFWG